MAVDVPIGGIAALFGRVLDLFRQKAFIYVEVSFGLPLPYALTVVNRSSFQLLVENLLVEPDGFPTEDNGWSLSRVSLFRGQLLEPGQRIRFFFATPDLGSNPLRKFSLTYETRVFGRRIPRSKQRCEYDFSGRSNIITVTSSFPVGARPRADRAGSGNAGA